MVALDPRINPFRPEIAAAHLKGQVEANKFVEGIRHDVIEPITAVHTTASRWSRQGTEAARRFGPPKVADTKGAAGK